MNYLQFDFVTEDEPVKEILMAFLAQSGFEGFEDEGRLLKAFIKENEFIEDRFEEIFKVIPATYTRTIIEPQNWNAQWESSFEPIIVNDFVLGSPWVCIRAGFHQPVSSVKHEIIITPKMSFGTGHHATTYLMIEQMANIDFKDKTVVDFGTGTGILSVLAEKMGAVAIDAIDNDEWSIENAKENLAANNCSHIKLHKADIISTGRKYDIILANINLNVISQNLPSITSSGVTGTLILLSGFFTNDADTLAAELKANKIIVTNRKQKGEWICLLCQVD